MGVIVTWIGRLLLGGRNHGDETVLLFMFYSMIIIGSTAGLSLWLAREYKVLREAQNS